MSELNVNLDVPKKFRQPIDDLNTKSTDDVKSRHAITIGVSPNEIYTFWRNFSNLALFMKDIETIEAISRIRSHWVVKLKSGAMTEWDADVIDDQPGHLISWRSVEGSDVSTVGTVWFEEATAKQGTVVRLAMDYHIPGGKLAELATFFTGESPEILIKTNLKRLKAYLETGEIPTTEGQPSGRQEDQKPVTH